MRSERIPGMNAIEIHTNENQMIIITQENFPDDDQTILLNGASVPRLVELLCRLKEGVDEARTGSVRYAGGEGGVSGE